MASDAKIWSQPEAPAAADSVEMPRPTAAPLVLALGITLLAAGVALGMGFLVVGAVVVVAGLSIWIVQLLPGRGHVHESLVETARPQPVMAVPGGVEHLRPGMPGYRLRLPQDVHPVSAGLKGGLAGGAAMPVPAVLWGLLSGHGLWYPVNLLAGIVLPGVGRMAVPELERFNASLLVVALVIHVVMSVVLGLIFGVLLPTLPAVPRPIAWGGLLMPILWTGASYAAMQVVNPALPGRVNWPWFLLSQFVFGITMPAVVLGAKRLPRVLAGVAGGLVGGAAMAAAGRPVGGGQRPRLLVPGQRVGGDASVRPGQPGRGGVGEIPSGLVPGGRRPTRRPVHLLRGPVRPDDAPVAAHAGADCLGRPGPASGMDRGHVRAHGGRQPRAPGSG